MTTADVRNLGPGRETGTVGGTSAGRRARLRTAIGSPVTDFIGSDGLPAGEPLGDPGLFGPESMAWRIHGDSVSLVVGSLLNGLLESFSAPIEAALLDSRKSGQDPNARIQRTMHFILVNTFGATETADRAIELVRRRHLHVRGVRPDGVPYAASDPASVTFVHTCEVYGNATAYRQLGPESVSDADIDRYYREYAVVARKLGAEDVPTSAREVDEYFERLRPSMQLSQPILEFMELLASGRDLSARGRRFLLQVGFAMLPPWAQELYGYDRSPRTRAAVIGTARQLAKVVRWSTGDHPVVAQAYQRTSVGQPSCPHADAEAAAVS